MMDNYTRTPIGLSLATLARSAAKNELQQTGKSLPVAITAVDGQFVTVKFEVNPGGFTIQNVSVPIQSSPYDWIPYQVGDTGIVQPADVHLAGIDGQNGATPNLEQSANLTALSFTPIAKKTATVSNANQRVVQGPQGVLLQTMSGSSVVDITPTSITLSCGGHTLQINSTGVIIDGKVFLTHAHTLVTTGVSDSGPVA